MLGHIMQEHGKKLLADVACPVAATVHIRASNLNQNYSMDFPSKDSAQDLIENCTTLSPEFLDPRTKALVTLHVGRDKSLSERQMGRVMKRLWEPN